MMVATGPDSAVRPMSIVSTSAAKRIVQMVMPDTGLLDEPTRPAMYADTEQKMNPATIMMIVIADATPRLSTMAKYSVASGRVKATMPVSTYFIGRSRSVWDEAASMFARAAARPL